MSILDFMGMDLVELVMRTEEEFDITIDDLEAGQIQTVGNLYNLVCKLRNIPPSASPEQYNLDQPTPEKYGANRSTFTESAESIWLKLVSIICDQLQIQPTEIRAFSHFQNDLGCD